MCVCVCVCVHTHTHTCIPAHSALSREKRVLDSAAASVAGGELPNTVGNTLESFVRTGSAFNC